MSYLNFKLTPPRRRTREANMSPPTYTRHSRATIVKQHPYMTDSDLQDMALDPQADPSDKTMDQYQQRVSSLLPNDRPGPELRISALPKVQTFEETFKASHNPKPWKHQLTVFQQSLGESIKTLREESNGEISHLKEESGHLKEESSHLKEESGHLNEKINHLKEESGHLKEKSSHLQEEIDRLNLINNQLKGENERRDRLRFEAYKADLLKDAINAMSEKQGIQTTSVGRNNPEHDSTRVAATARQILSKVSPLEFQRKFGLPPQYRDCLKNYETFMQNRNAIAHDNQYEIAHLLLKPYFQENSQIFNIPYWEKLLLWVHGSDSLQDMAAKADAEIAQMGRIP